MIHFTFADRLIVILVGTGDLDWAFSGLSSRPRTARSCANSQRELKAPCFVNYGVEAVVPARRWRTVTPIALSLSAERRRIDPLRVRDRANRKTAPSGRMRQPPLGLVYVFKLRLVPGGLDALPRTASLPERSEVPR